MIAASRAAKLVDQSYVEGENCKITYWLFDKVVSLLHFLPKLFRLLLSTHAV